MFALSAGNCGDAPEGRALLQRLGPVDHSVYLLMDRAYEGDETRALAMELGYVPVVPPKSNPLLPRQDGADKIPHAFQSQKMRQQSADRMEQFIQTLSG